MVSMSVCVVGAPARRGGGSSGGLVSQSGSPHAAPRRPRTAGMKRVRRLPPSVNAVSCTPRSRVTSISSSHTRDRRHATCSATSAAAAATPHSECDCGSLRVSAAKRALFRPLPRYSGRGHEPLWGRCERPRRLSRALRGYSAQHGVHGGACDGRGVLCCVRAAVRGAEPSQHLFCGDKRGRW